MKPESEVFVSEYEEPGSLNGNLNGDFSERSEDLRVPNEGLSSSFS